MYYAVSPITGKEYAAWSLSYEQVRTLKLFCPVCKSKVFKRVRHNPAETHFFCHHVGGSPECELYRPGMGDGSPTVSFATKSRGQDFEFFIKSVAEDIRTMLVAAHVIQAPVDIDAIKDIRHFLEPYQFDEDRETLDGVEANAFVLLFETDDPHLDRSEDRLRIICGFHRNRQARFVDKELAVWLTYAIEARCPESPRGTVVDAFISDQTVFDSYSALLLCGLALLYAQHTLAGVSPKFASLTNKIASELVRPSRPAPAKPRSQRSDSVAQVVTKKAMPAEMTSSHADADLPHATKSVEWATFQFRRSTETLTHLPSGRQYTADQLRRVYGMVPGWEIRDGGPMVWAADMYTLFVP